ncbi:hypothetical protein C2G38_2094922, partial [Gigaspora rosea]
VLESVGGKALADALCMTSALISLDLRENHIWPKERTGLADAFYKNTTPNSNN